MQSGSCSFSRLEMASERMKTFIFRNAEKNQEEKSELLERVSTKDISASRKAKNFFKKGKLIFIKKSSRWAQSGFCSFNRLEVTSKTINLYQEWLVQKILFKRCDIMSPFTMEKALRSV